MTGLDSGLEWGDKEPAIAENKSIDRYRYRQMVFLLHKVAVQEIQNCLDGSCTVENIAAVVCIFDFIKFHALPHRLDMAVELRLW